ncbi:MAG: AAA family ATPase [Candidatus Omnitrophota bacterium]
MKIFAIANQKGGCGKTTTAINLAAALGQKGKRTLLIDLDPQAHASIGLGFLNVDSTQSVFCLFSNNPEKNKPLTRLIKNAEPGLDVLPSHIILSTIEHELRERTEGILILTKAITHANLDYDYIIIDCPPNLGFLTFNALRAANEIIVPVETSVFSIMGVGKLLSMVELIKIKLHHAPHIKGLVTMFDEYSDFSQKMLNKIRFIFKDRLIKTFISFDMAVRQAQEKTVSIYKSGFESRAGHDYMGLANELINSSGHDPAEDIYQEMNKILHGSYGSVYSKEKMFTFYAPRAKKVHIVGDFNNWKIDDASGLDKKDSGDWEKSFYLLPGQYRYKFVADGLWFWDPQNPAKERNPYGDFDSIIKV